MKLLTIRCMILGAVFLPIWELITSRIEAHIGLLFVIGVFIALDTISGVYAAFRLDKAQSKTFWVKFFDKFMSYTVVLILAFTVFILTQMSEMYRMDLENAKYIITYPLSVILVREFWSIGENINKIQPGLFDNIKSIFSKIFKK